jgi:hypothetical protein
MIIRRGLRPVLLAIVVLLGLIDRRSFSAVEVALPVISPAVRRGAPPSVGRPASPSPIAIIPLSVPFPVGIVPAARAAGSFAVPTGAVGRRRAFFEAPDGGRGILGPLKSS